MRRVGLMVLCLALIAVACGDDTSSTTSTAATSSTTTSVVASTTSAATDTTIAPGPVASALLCITGRAPGEFADIRTEPDASAGLVSQLPQDATGIQATGSTSGAWTEIIWDGEAAWVESYFLTAGDCDLGTGPETYAVTDIACGGFVNVRDGVTEDHDVLGTLDAEAFDIAGTGVTATDAEDRTWVQIMFLGRNAWVAGWFITTDPGPTVECGLELPWLLTAEALGPIELGAQASDLDSVTGWTWRKV